jgi:hypothetical protein
MPTVVMTDSNLKQAPVAAIVRRREGPIRGIACRFVLMTGTRRADDGAYQDAGKKIRAEQARKLSC